MTTDYEAKAREIAREHVNDVTSGRLEPCDVVSNIAEDMCRFAAEARKEALSGCTRDCLHQREARARNTCQVCGEPLGLGALETRYGCTSKECGRDRALAGRKEGT